MEAFLSTGEINIYNALFRLFLGVIAGGLIGMDREKINRAAGFRTHILICMGACLLMLISIYIPQQFLSFKNGDPSRIASQVVTGIGFLGAGAIIKLGDNVKGLTTAASIWISAAIGLGIGAGMLWIALAALILVLFSLIVLGKIERVLFKKLIYKILSIQLKQSIIEINSIEDILKKYKVKYEVQEYRQSSYLGLLNLEIAITIDNRFPLEEFMTSLSAISNLQEIAVKSKQ